MIIERRVAIGETAVLWGLHAANLEPVEQPFIDPPTAAAFRILRIDTLSVGETLVETGHQAKSVRVQVENLSDAPATFRMEIKLGPNYAKMTHELGNVVENAWRRTFDDLRRGRSAG